MAENSNPFLVTTRSPDHTYEISGVNDEGKRMWVSRAWLPGERAEYCRLVLHLEPYAKECSNG